MKKQLTGIFTLALLAVNILSGAQAFAWGRFDGGAHPRFDPHYRHDPVVIHRAYVDHRVGGGGCVGCGVGIAALAGLALGAAIVGGSSAPPPEVVEAPPQVIVQQAPVVVQQVPMYAPGTQLAALPGGCAAMNVNGTNYYQCGPTWYQPFFGGNGVYYTVVPTP